MKLISCLVVALVSGAAASAAQFDFYKLSDPTIGADFPSSNGFLSQGDRVSSDVENSPFPLNGNLTFSDGGITVKATGTYFGNEVAVIQDHETGWTTTTGAGLGVYHKSNPVDTSDDNITFGEKLTLKFDQVVNVTRIDLRAEGHNINGWIDGATFLLNGVQTLLPKGSGFINVNFTGDTLVFAYDDLHVEDETPDQFYVAAITAATTTPDSGTTLSTLAGAMGALAIFRKRFAK